MPFDTATRRRGAQLGTQAKGVSNPLRWELPKVGYLAGIYLNISGSVAGSLSAPNAAGFSSIINRVRVVTNGGINLIDLSGPHYFWQVVDFLHDYRNLGPGSGRTAVTATTFTLNMYLPIALNLRDPIGLFALQNPQTQVSLEVQFETDSVVATGATVTASVTPKMIYFSVPVRDEDRPDVSVAHQLLGEDRVISGSGQNDWLLPRGNTYVSAVFGAYLNTTNADSWTTAELLLNQSDVLEEWTPGLLDVEYAHRHGRARVLGVLPFDFIGTAGLGNLGSARDLIYTANVTEFVARINLSGAGTLRLVRRQLVKLPSVAN